MFSCWRWLSSFSTGAQRRSVVAEPTISSLCLALVMATFRRRQSFNSSPNYERRSSRESDQVLTHLFTCLFPHAEAQRKEMQMEESKKADGGDALTCPSSAVLLTKEKMIRLLSRPWYLSTVFTSTPVKAEDCSRAEMLFNCCLQGAITPISLGLHPAWRELNEQGVEPNKLHQLFHFHSLY